MKKQFLIFSILIFAFLFVGLTQFAQASTISDNFNDGNADGWISVAGYPPGTYGNWRVEDGVVIQDQGRDHYGFVLDNFSMSDQTVEAKVLWHDNGYAGITIWNQNANNWVQISYPYHGGFGIWENVNGGGLVYPTATYPVEINQRIWQTMKIEANSSTGEIAVYLDNNYLFTHTVGANTVRTGLSGFNSGNAGGSFDDFRIILNDEDTTCGKSYTQGGLIYGTVQGSDGKCWLDRNLGATQVATASNDSASYGWLFQWGRGADGHQIRTSQVTSTPSSTDVPGHDFFIHGTGYNADWRDPRNDNLWQGVNGINNPCPAGFRLPTKQEWTTLVISAGITNSVTAFDSVLKLPLGGYRGHVGNYLDEYLYSYYWSSTVDDGSFIHEGRSFYLTIGAPGERGYYNDIGSAGRAGGFSVRCLADSFTATPSCTSWTYSNWSTCSSSGQQTRTVTSSSPSGCSGGNPVLNQSCTYVPPTCSSWAYSNWSACSSSGQQTRTVTSSSPSGCTGGSPVISQSCTPSSTTCTSWAYSGWSTCSSSGQQTRTVASSSPSSCIGGNPILSQSCTPSTTATTCTSWTYSNWGACSSSGQQTRTINSSSPSNCTGGSPVTTQSCTYTEQCTADTWECGNWGDCSSNGTKTRSCTKTYDCSTASTASPSTSQSCTYVPPCTEDTWECEGWSECSPLGIKTRNCKKTYDCSNVETTPNNYQTCTYTGNNNTKVQHEAIIKSTVQLLCFNNSNGIVGSGSGTIINSSGVILTNKHVIKDRNNKDLDGCFVGLTTNINNYPDFSEVAFILDQSASEDMALLKIYNGSNNYSFTDINSGNSQNLSFSKNILAYGYPVYNMQPKTVDDLIQKITFSSGDYSGDEGYGYFKTTAMLEHGISGGGAYTEEGIFTGITTAGLVGEINTMGLILRIENVKNWINSTGVSSKLTKEVSNLSSTLDFNSANVKNFNATADNNGSNSNEVVKEEKKLITKIDNSLSKRMSGNILLQVEKKGEGWYVNPDNKKKYYLGRPADAFSIMRNLGLGIKHNELTKYLNSKFSSKLSGKILLDVEKNGEAYYINPKNLKGYFLSRPADAFKVMRDLGLGITNTDIRKIDVGEIK